MRVKPNYYAVLPAEVRYDNSLTDSEKILYSEIVALSNHSGECWATNTYFANLYSVTVVTISRRISKLKNKGYVDVNIVYKKDSKQIEKRVIKIADPYYQNNQGGINNPDNTPINRIVKDNNTSIEYYKNNNIVPFFEIIEYLNKKVSKKFRGSASHKKHIQSRWNEGYTLEDFETVIDNKASEWLGTDMEKYLQPSTLFGTKFDNYLNQAPKVPVKKEAIIPVYKEGEEISQEEAQEIREWIKGLSENQSD